mgnify:CR=1 FL=1
MRKDERKVSTFNRHLKQYEISEKNYAQMIGDVQREIDELNSRNKKLDQLLDYENRTREQTRRNQTHESMMNLLLKDFEVFHDIDKIQLEILSSLQSSNSDLSLVQDKSNQKKFLLYELLTGVNIVERKKSRLTMAGSSSTDCSMTDEAKTSSSWLEIWLLNLPDECLSKEIFENLNQLPQTKERMRLLSPALLDQHRNMIKVSCIKSLLYKIQKLNPIKYINQILKKIEKKSSLATGRQIKERDSCQHKI